MKRIFLSLCAILSALLMVETVVRGSIPVDQVPALAWDASSQLLIHRPHQTGVRYPDRDLAHPVRYSINAQGWNAQFDYPERDYSKHLAIVIGDSFVEALQVTPNESLVGQLQDKLEEPARACHQLDTFHWRADVQMTHGPCPVGWRVYGMGMSGAPLSQYLQMARFAERTYHPDIIIVILVHNDFIESYERPDNPLYESFWHTDGVKMIGPKVYKPRMWSDVMASPWATGRLAIQTLSRMSQQPKTAGWQMGVDTSVIDTTAGHYTERVTDYLFGQFAQLQKKTALLFAMDGPRDYIEHGYDPKKSPVYPLNTLAQSLAARHGLRFVDLTAAFVQGAGYVARIADRPMMQITTTGWTVEHLNGIQAEYHELSFPADYHWNSYAHDLVARTLLPMVVKQ